MAVLATAAGVAYVHVHGPFAKPVRILVPVSPGGTSDIAARVVADQLTKSLGRPVVVENRVGATGRIAARALKDAAPDGNTILLAPLAVTVIAPLVFKRLDYDPVRDFVPVSQVATYDFALAVTSSLPVRTVTEFVAWSNAHPDKAHFGTFNSGTVSHFMGEMIIQETGIGMIHVPYGSLSQLQTQVISGQLVSGISTVTDFIELHRAGMVRIIATSGARRSTLLPDVPTFREQGFPTVEASGWTAIYAPAGTPRAVVDRYSAAIVKAVHVPEVREKFLRLGIEPSGTTPQELAAILAADSAHWRKVIRTSGFVVQ